MRSRGGDKLVTKLRFDMEEVRHIAEHSAACRRHRAAASQLRDLSLASATADPASIAHGGGSLVREDVDELKVPPALWWVKDAGTYLMSSAVEPLAGEDGRPHRMAFAEGLSRCRGDAELTSLLGAGSFCEVIVLDDELMSFIRDPDAAALVIAVESSSVSFQILVEARPRPAPRMRAYG